MRVKNWYEENVFSKFTPKFVWAKTFDDFVNYITNNNMPGLISFDNDLKPQDPEHNGIDAANWLVEYCKENNKQLPWCFTHSANPKQRPIINHILGIPNE